ncbi:MAG TPA: hypothetical protein VGM06_22310 [Polyangiaceae bacterium]
MTVILPPRRPAGPWAWLNGWLPPGTVWPPSRRTAALALALSPVLAGIVVSTQLRPRGAERVGASVMAYVSPSAQEGPPVASGDRLVLASPPPSEMALTPPPVRVSEGPRCELPVVQVEELPVARAQPPASVWAAFAASSAVEPTALPEPAPPKPHPIKGARARSHRSIDDLVRKMNASASTTKY